MTTLPDNLEEFADYLNQIIKTDNIYKEDLLRILFLHPSINAPTFLHKTLDVYVAANFVFRDVLYSYLETILFEIQRYQLRYDSYWYHASSLSRLSFMNEKEEKGKEEKKRKGGGTGGINIKDISYPLTSTEPSLLDPDFNPNSKNTNKRIGKQLYIILNNGKKIIDVIMENCFEDKLHSLSIKDVAKWLSMAINIFNKGSKIPEIQSYAIDMIQKLIIYGCDPHHPMIFNFLHELFDSSEFEVCVMVLNKLFDVEFDINYQNAVPFQSTSGIYYVEYTVVALSIIYGRIDILEWLFFFFGPIPYAGQDEEEIGVRNIDLDQIVLRVDDGYPSEPTEGCYLIALPLFDFDMKTYNNADITNNYEELILCELCKMEYNGLKIDITQTNGSRREFIPSDSIKSKPNKTSINKENINKCYNFIMQYFCIADQTNTFDPLVHDMSTIRYKPLYGDVIQKEKVI